jgi:hypothetical protein
MESGVWKSLTPRSQKKAWTRIESASDSIRVEDLEDGLEQPSIIYKHLL